MEIARARGTGQSPARLVVTVGRAMFRNALILGILLGFIVNLGGIPLPAPVTGTLELMVRAALPAALFGLGGVLVRYRPEGDLKVIGYVVGVSLLLHPATVWLMGRATDLGQAGFRSAVLTAAMAPGVNAYIFANMYGRARRVAASSVLLATGTSVITIWLWLAIIP
jgi:predicted permease